MVLRDTLNMKFSGLHREERDQMLRALDVLRTFDRNAVEGQPPDQFDRDTARVWGRVPGEAPAKDELWQLALGLLHVGRGLIYQIADDEGGTAQQVFDGYRHKITAATLLD